MVLFGGPQDTVLRFVGKGRQEGEVVLHDATARRLARHLLDEYAPDWPTPAESDDATLFDAARRLVERRLSDQAMPVLRGRGTRPLPLSSVNAIFCKYRDAAGLPATYGPHSLRHTCATQLLEREVDIRVVQEFLRHRNIRSTTVYTAVTRGRKATAAARLPVDDVQEGTAV
jgi:site-specific recombinase XerD